MGSVCSRSPPPLARSYTVRAAGVGTVIECRDGVYTTTVRPMDGPAASRPSTSGERRLLDHHEPPPPP